MEVDWEPRQELCHVGRVPRCEFLGVAKGFRVTSFSLVMKFESGALQIDGAKAIIRGNAVPARNGQKSFRKVSNEHLG